MNASLNKGGYHKQEVQMSCSMKFDTRRRDMTFDL